MMRNLLLPSHVAMTFFGQGSIYTRRHRIRLVENYGPFIAVCTWSERTLRRETEQATLLDWRMYVALVRFKRHEWPNTRAVVVDVSMWVGAIEDPLAQSSSVINFWLEQPRRRDRTSLLESVLRRSEIYRQRKCIILSLWSSNWYSVPKIYKQRKCLIWRYSKCYILNVSYKWLTLSL